MKETTVVSIGNIKIGACPNVSLLPGKTCPKDCKCYTKCYAKKALRRPCVFNKWAANTKLWEENPPEFERQIMVYLEKHPAKYFRWQVAGDIPDVNYLRMMERVARRFPDTKFLCFTKQYEMVMGEQGDLIDPPNLTIVISGWPKWKNSLFLTCATYYPVSQVHLKGEPRRFIKDHKLIECPGKCGPCDYKCWKLKVGEMVEFKEH